MKGVEHGAGYVNLMGDFPELLRAVRESAQRRIFTCPDLDWYRVHSTTNEANHSSLETLRSRTGVEFRPEAIVTAWENDVQEAREKGGYGSVLARKTLTYLMAREGAPLLVSAGAGPFIVPGFSMLEELRLFEASGLSRFEALQAATVRMAEFFGEEAEWGTVTEGKKAFLLLLEQNPTESLDALEEIGSVVLGNQVLDREMLLEGLGSAVEAVSHGLRDSSPELRDGSAVGFPTLGLMSRPRSEEISTGRFEILLGAGLGLRQSGRTISVRRFRARPSRL